MADLRADIEKYLSGKLTPAEMHALEKKALDDPFLAEAIEGGSMLPADEFANDVNALRKAIDEKTTREKKSQPGFWLWPMRIAAGLLLLAASTYIVINLIDKNTKTSDPIALRQEKAEPLPGRAGAEPDSTSAESNLTTEESSQRLLAEKKDQPETVESESARASGEIIQPEQHDDGVTAVDDEIDKKEEVQAHEKISVDEKPLLTIPSVTDDAKHEDLSRAKSRTVEKESGNERRDIAASSPAGAVSSAQLLMPTKQVKGKVTDIDDGLPLPGVNILVEGTTIGTVTDLNGYFQIDIPEKQNSLVFSYIGMESKEIVVDETNKNPETMEVQLAPDVSELSEVVVTGFGTGEEPPSMEDIKWEITEPEGGKKNYRNYLQQNLHYPEVALRNNIEGKVTVQFTVEPNGQLTEFRVVKSLNTACDDEVIRLIKEGPKWRATKRNDEPVKSKAKVKLRFELPSKKKN